MNRKRWMILAVCMLVLLSLAACGKADGGDASGAAALESALRQVRDKLDEAKHDEAESGSTGAGKNAGTGGGCGAGAVSS